MTLRELKRQGIDRLEAVKLPDADFECACLLETVTGFDRTQCLCRADESVPKETERRFFTWIDRRAAGEPLQYILGKWSFYGRDFFVGAGVLIPRPETEELVETANAVLKQKPQSVVFDLCAGSGCIGLTLAKENPGCTVYLFEKYDEALFYLRKNKAHLGALNAHIVKADILKDVPANEICADLLVSNPPYIPTAEIGGLQREVLCEPWSALDGGADGLCFYRAVAAVWLPFVKPNGKLLFECGDGQGDQIASLFRSKTAKQEILFDFQDIDRFVRITV